MGNICTFDPLIARFMYNYALAITVLCIISLNQICDNRSLRVAVICRHSAWLENDSPYLKGISVQFRYLIS